MRHRLNTNVRRASSGIALYHALSYTSRHLAVHRCRTQLQIHMALPAVRAALLLGAAVAGLPQLVVAQEQEQLELETPLTLTERIVFHKGEGGRHPTNPVPSLWMLIF